MALMKRISLIIILISLFSLFSIVNEFAGFVDWSKVGQELLDPGNDINPYIASLSLLFIFIVELIVLN